MAEVSRFKLLIICGVIAAIVVVCLIIFLPNWRGSGALPTLEFYPKPKNHQTTLISFEASNKASYMSWANSLGDYLEKYYKIRGSIASRLYACSYNGPPPDGATCEVDLRDWSQCSKERWFGYYKSSPCIFLKLNTDHGWIPEYYESENELPDDMPMQLKQHILEVFTVQPNARHTVWISCEGETAADKEFVGEVSYYPSIQGYPGYYFPYSDTEEFFSPLVAVEFKRPKTGVLINIECRAWAKNILYNDEKKTGFVHFGLLIE